MNTNAENIHLNTALDAVKIVDSEKILIDIRDPEITENTLLMIENLIEIIRLRIRLERIGRNIEATSHGIRAAKNELVAAAENDKILEEILSSLHRAGIYLSMTTEMRAIDYEDEWGQGYGPKPVTTISVYNDRKRLIS